MKRLLYYYLAFFVWILIILMCISIILIPIYKILKDNNWWFDEPFNEARRNAEDFWERRRR